MPLCDKPGCGLEMMKAHEGPGPGAFICKRDRDAHALCAEVARLTSANAALEAKLLSADDALMECFSIACLQGGAYRISREAEAAYGDACDRYEARKKGAEHGE